MSITRPVKMSPEDMERLVGLLAQRGARIEMSDPRVTSAQTWLIATIGALLVTIGGWGVKSINDLNQTMTRVVTQNVYRDAQVDRIEQHLEVVDGRLVIVERKVK